MAEWLKAPVSKFDPAFCTDLHHAVNLCESGADDRSRQRRFAFIRTVSRWNGSRNGSNNSQVARLGAPTRRCRSALQAPTRSMDGSCAHYVQFGFARGGDYPFINHAPHKGCPQRPAVIPASDCSLYISMPASHIKMGAQGSRQISRWVFCLKVRELPPKGIGLQTPLLVFQFRDPSLINGECVREFSACRCCAILQ